jgi:hypothetical protein
VKENAILIYGPRKAGTTLLQRLVDGSSLYVYPTELKLKKLVSARWSSKDGLVEKYLQSSLLLKTNGERFDVSHLVAQIRQRLPKATSLREMILTDISAAITASPPGKWTGWAVKEVGGDFDAILNDWKKMFPDSKVLVIVRSPFYVSRSVFRDRRRKNIRLGVRSIIQQIIKPWQVIEAIGTHAKRSDLHLVYYDDIVSDTEAQMRSIAEFLGIDFVAAMTYPTLFGEPVVVGTASRPDKSIFREQTGFLSELTATEATLLILIGGAFLIKNMLGGKIRVSKGTLRLIMPANIGR